ncbi:MAG: four helix bundle protein [Pirellulales bacterium]|nr:four helix bundle protein [Pirellulales bacterium]
MSNHEDLEAWQRSIDLVDRVYDLARKLPTDERYGIVTQIQRAAISVPANLAEGCGRDTTKDFLRHVSIARGSLAEVSTFLTIIRRRKFVAESELKPIESELQTVGRLISGLRRSLRHKINSAKPKN